jgi:hypothetical protein
LREERRSALVPDNFEQGGKKILCSQRIVSGLRKICFLTCSIENFYFSSICNLYRDDFPSAPPGSYINSGNNSAWVSHHQKLSTYFLKFPSQRVLRKNQLWKDLENIIVFIYFPGKLQQCSLDFFKVLPKLRLIWYHSCQFQLGCYKATHHGNYRAMLEGTPKWTLFQETSLTFLKSLKIHLFYVKRVRDYNINLVRVWREHPNTFAHSKVKGFMWLFCSHALPVGTRMRGKNARTKCPYCYEEEDIHHMSLTVPRPGTSEE